VVRAREFNAGGDLIGIWNIQIPTDERAFEELDKPARRMKTLKGGA
jgi:hypothetical protein